MRSTLLSFVALLPLVGCQSLDGKVASVTASDRFADVCRAAPAAHAAFIILAANVKVPESVRKAEATAYSVIRTTCANPPVDVASAMVTVAEAYADVLELQASVAAKQI